MLPVCYLELQSRPLLLTYQTMSQSPGFEGLTLSFDTIRSVFDKSSENAWWYTEKERQGQKSSNKNCQCSYCQARKLVVPMASLYLFREPLIITPNQNFVVFYWKSYVTEVLKAWKQDGDVHLDKVILPEKMLKVNLLDYQQWMTTYTGHMS